MKTLCFSNARDDDKKCENFDEQYMQCKLHKKSLKLNMEKYRYWVCQNINCGHMFLENK